MKLYVHTQKGTKAALVEEKEFAVVLEMEGTGEMKEMSLNTLKRWWKPVEDKSMEPQNAQIWPETSETVETTTESAVSDTEDLGASEGSPDESEETEDSAEEAETTENADGEPLKMSAVVSALEDLFDKLNGIYFDGKLTKPVITVQSTPKAYGHCTTKKIWKSDETAQYEINIGAEYINRQMPNTAATMCHEMVHLYCLENEIADTCQKGRYHNGTFKKEAEARDLKIDYDRANGYSTTAPTEAFNAKLAESGFDMTIKFARITPSKKASSERVKAHKYVCPLCGQEVKTTSELSLICGHCEVPMDLEG